MRYNKVNNIHPCVHGRINFSEKGKKKTNKGTKRRQYDMIHGFWIRIL
jgi:hypothetical protein